MKKSRHKEKSVTSEMFSDKFLSKILKKFGGSWLTVFDVNDVNPLPHFPTHSHD